MDRPLSSDEAALWARVLETVRPLRVAPKPAEKAVRHPVAAPVVVAKPVKAAPIPVADLAALLRGERTPGKAQPAKVVLSKPVPSRTPANTLDGSWDKKLARGLVSPDCSIDLHGHNLSTAYATLDGALEQSIRMGDRVVLLVTGKPPRAESERPHARGAIRAAIGDWLAGSRHAGAIAAVRGAHPRHGGAGALYIILRRA